MRARRADRRDVLGRDDAELGPAVERRQLDLEPAVELALLRPDPAHLRAGVAGDHPGQCRAGSGRSLGAERGCAPRAPRHSSRCRRRPSRRGRRAASARSRAARRARRARDIDERSGTPITGSSVCAATTPGSAAASPAPQISTLIPRPAADFAYSATASGVRWAERTSNSQAIAARVELVHRGLHARAVGLGADEDADERISHPPPPRCRAGSARPRTTRCSTASYARARASSSVGATPVTERILPPFVTSCAPRTAVPPWKTSAPAALCGLDARRSRRLRSRFAPGTRARRRRRSRPHRRAERHAASAEVAARRRGERGEQVAFEARHQHLRLRVAEAGVELEHPRAVGGRASARRTGSRRTARRGGRARRHRLSGSARRARRRRRATGSGE